MLIRPRTTALGAALLLALGSATGALAQALSPAFTYQGELRTAGNPANASFDMEFRLYRTVAGGDQIGPTVTRNAVPVSGGLFAVALDFGPAQFAGDRQWLEVRIRPAGGGSFETLSPRTEVTATPYAWSAANALANSVTGSSIVDGSVGLADINTAQVQRRITGTCPTGQYVRAMNQDGTVSCGTDAVGSPGWSLTGNAGTDPNANFIGTTDARAFTIRVGNANALRLTPAGGTVGSPRTINVIGGSQANAIGGNTEGATIAGGGGINQDIGTGTPSPAPNRVTADFGTIGGGRLNSVEAVLGSISGGNLNTVIGAAGTIAGGTTNRSGNLAAVGGGEGNNALGLYATIPGGFANLAAGEASSVAGGERNCAGGHYSWAGGYRAKVRRINTSNTNLAGCQNVPVNGTTGDQGTFVWADRQEADFISSGPNQFLVRAQGGVGINSNGPPAGIDLEVRNREGSGSSNVDLYLRTAAHNRGINLAMLPTAGAAEFRVSQSNGTGFSDRLIILSNGDFEVTAQAFKPGGGAWASPSDARLKSDVTSLSGALDRLLSLRGVQYHYLKDRTPAGMYLPGAQIGFLAQEVEKVFPDWVGETGAGYKTVGPRGFEALTVEALRELRAESATIDRAQSQRLARLEAENAMLRKRLARLEAMLER